MACYDSGAEHHLQSLGLYGSFQASGYRMLQATIRIIGLAFKVFPL